jgi:hypothetical protein
MSGLYRQDAMVAKWEIRECGVGNREWERMGKKTPFPILYLAVDSY